MNRTTFWLLLMAAVGTGLIEQAPLKSLGLYMTVAAVILAIRLNSKGE